MEIKLEKKKIKHGDTITKNAVNENDEGRMFVWLLSFRLEEEGEEQTHISVHNVVLMMSENLITRL